MVSNQEMFLIANLSGGIVALISIICILVGVAIGVVAAKLIINKKIGETKEHVKGMLDNAQKEAERLRKEALLEVKEEKTKLIENFNEQEKQLRFELQKQEQRLNNKEEMLTRKEQSLDAKTDNVERIKARLDEKENNLNILEDQLNESKAQIDEKIQNVAKMSQEEAKQLLIQQMKDDAKKEAVQEIKEIEQKYDIVITRAELIDGGLVANFDWGPTFNPDDINKVYNELY